MKVNAESYVTEVEYSGYGIATVLNKILVDAGRTPIRPQMMYNYLRNGLIVKGEKIFGENLRKVTNEEVRNFLVRYIERNKIEMTESDVSEDQLELFEL